MKLRRELITVSMVALLGGCNPAGQTGNVTTPVSVTPAPTSTPAPTPSPTPTPTPSPTPTPASSGYTPIAQLTGSGTLLAASTGYALSNDVFAFGVGGFGEGLPLGYNIPAQSYLINNGPAQNFTFGPANLIPGSPAGTLRYRLASGVELAVIVPNGNVEQYVRFYDYIVPGSVVTNRIFGLAGIPTRSNDIPNQGTVAYRLGRLYGSAFVGRPGNRVQYDLSPSQVGLTIDFGARRITTQIDLIGTPVSGGANTSLGRIQLVATFDGVIISSSITQTNFTVPAMPQVAAGVLFGPQGQEAGFALAYATSNGIDSAMEINVVGSAVR